MKKPTALSCVLLLGLQRSLEVHAEDDGTCPALPGYKSALRVCFDENCKAEDVKIGSLDEPVVAVVDGVEDTCTDLDDTISFTANLLVDVNGGDRYDIGLWIGPLGTTEVGDDECEAYTFGCTLDSTGVDDADGCGDQANGSATYNGIQFTVPCTIQNGKLPFPYCTSWAQNAGIACTGAVDVAPGTTAKCKCSATEISVDLCVVIIEPSLLEIGLPDTCPPAGENIDLTIPGDAISGTFGDSPQDVTIYVVDDSEIVSTQEYTLGSGDVTLTVPNIAAGYSLRVSNPYLGGCEAEQAFTIDCAFCDDHDCGDGFFANDLTSGTPCDLNQCSDSQCCITEASCDDHMCEEGNAANPDLAGGFLCGSGSCTDAQCCVGTCAAHTCGDGNIADPDLPEEALCELFDCVDDDCCIPQICDTSYGCLDVQDASCASPKLTDIDGVDANRWGWYMSETFYATEQVFLFDMYAGAGQNVLANGDFAGQVEVVVNGDGSSDYTLLPLDGYCFDDVHVHVGNKLPTQKKKGVTTTTVAPGQYTQTTLEAGLFYIIVHVGETCTPCGR